MRGPGDGIRAYTSSVGLVPKPNSGIDVQEEISDQDSQEDKSVQVRSLFPETWLWDIVTVGLVTVTGVLVLCF